jgi:hypothetical protein
MLSDQLTDAVATADAGDSRQKHVLTEAVVRLSEARVMAKLSEETARHSTKSLAYSFPLIESPHYIPINYF